MVTVQCQNCGHKINVPDHLQGRSFKCVACNCVINVSDKSPQSVVDIGVSLDLPQQNDAVGQTDHEGSLDYLMQDVHDRAGKSQDSGGEESDNADASDAGILSYPFNPVGFTMMGVFILTPALLSIIGFGLIAYFGPILLLFPLFVAFWGIRLVMASYMLWYVSICILESADGNNKTPEVMTMDDSFGQSCTRVFYLYASIAFCSGPATIYYWYFRQYDLVFGLLLAFGSFFQPMAILSVSINDSYIGLNPILIVRSIRRTFRQYINVLLVFYLTGVIIAGFIFGRIAGISKLILFIPSCLAVYLLLILANILGRFYCKNEYKLGWEC